MLIVSTRPDPNGILDFTVQQLQAAEDAGQRVWIMAHMPPGRADVMRDQVRSGHFFPKPFRSVILYQSNYFNQIVLRYRNTIAGQFYGHTHMVSYIWLLGTHNDDIYYTRRINLQLDIPTHLTALRRTRPLFALLLHL